MRAKVTHRGTVKTPLYEPTYLELKNVGKAVLYLGNNVTTKSIRGIMRGISQEKNRDPDKQLFLRMYTELLVDDITGETVLTITHKEVKRKNIL